MTESNPTTCRHQWGPERLHVDGPPKGEWLAADCGRCHITRYRPAPPDDSWTTLIADLIAARRNANRKRPR